MAEKVKKFSIIVALDNSGVIGLEKRGIHTIYWPRLERDMAFFRSTTRCVDVPDFTNAIIVGHNTWQTLGENYRKASGRTHYVISRTEVSDRKNVKVFPSFDEALEAAQASPTIHKIYVIGGAAIYRQALAHPDCEFALVTRINKRLGENEYPHHRRIMFPISPDVLQSHSILQGRKISCTDSDHSLDYSIMRLELSPDPNERGSFQPPSETRGECQYLSLIRRIYEAGTFKEGRNGSTYSVYGHQLVYDLADGVPLLTIRKSYPRLIFEELMWMIRGQTDSKILESRNVNIWKGNSSAEFILGRGLPYREGDIGPGYGFQMRHFGATYTGCDSDYTGQGVDQLEQCIQLIKNDPSSRRIIISLWNPTCTNEMTLPPCHVMYNFSVEEVDGRKRLHCHLYQRSWDVIVGWNTSTAGFLTLLLAHHCGIEPGKVIHSINDAHIYDLHIAQGVVDKLLRREPKKPPKLEFVAKHDRIEDYRYEDLVIHDYNPHPPIKVTMVA